MMIKSNGGLYLSTGKRDFTCIWQEQRSEESSLIVLTSNKMEGRHLPEDIIENILLKLPTKSIIRFKSISKSWFKLIKSTCFVNRHLIKSKESFIATASVVRRRFLALCIYDEHKGITFDPFLAEGVNKSLVVDFELPSPYDHNYFKLVAPCNGIVRLTIDSDIILLVNPSLKEVKMLPTSPSPVENSVRCFKLVGFGFDNTMDLKVVRITGLVVSPRAAIRHEYQRAEVYNLRSNAWRELDEFPLLTDSSIAGLTDSSIGGSTFFDGVVHWCAKTDYSDWRMLTFNMDTELFEHVEFPQGWNNGEDYWYNEGGDVPALFVLNNESIAFVSYCPAYYTDHLVNIWTMNKHGNEVSWTKLYSIGPLPKLLKPIGFPKKQEFMYSSHDGGELILYDLLNHRHSVVGEAFMSSIEMELCRASLVSINM